MLRSKEMTAVQLIERNDAARAIVTELGVLGVVEFRDMNAGVPFYKRAFSDEVRRCEAMSRRLDNLLRMLRDNRLKPWDRDTDAALAPIADADSNVRQMDADLMQVRQQEVLAMNSHNALKEHLLVLTAGATVHGSALRGGAPTSLAPSTSTGAMEEGGVQLGPLPPPAVTGTTNVGSQQNPNILQFVVGTIPRAVALKFARAVHRVSRGNCMTHEFPLEERLLDGDPKNPRRDRARLLARRHRGVCTRALHRDPPRRPIAKNFFMIFYSGSVLHSKLQKLCLHFGASTFPYPGALNERQSIEMRLRQASPRADPRPGHVRATPGTRACTRHVLAAAPSRSRPACRRRSAISRRCSAPRGSTADRSCSRPRSSGRTGATSARARRRRCTPSICSTSISAARSSSLRAGCPRRRSRACDPHSARPR